MALPDHTIPDKQFYTIGDVSRITNTKAHILRYWESQFKLLRPARRYSGHRKFTQREVDLINRIRYLILERRFTLAGAKREINRQIAGKTTKERTGESTLPTAAAPLLREIKRDVDDCLTILRSEDAIQQELVGLK